MSAEAVTRQNMIIAMETHCNASVTERLGRNWRRLNTIVADQSDVNVSGARLDFHMLEFVLDGRLDLDSQGEMEAGDSAKVTALPGSLSYFQSNAPIYQRVLGDARIQHIYIENSVFEEVANAIAPGDPDNLKPLGFQGIFEPQLRHLANAVLEEARRPSAGGDLCADILAQQIALLILRRRLGGKERQSDIHPLSNAEISRVVEFIESHLEDVGGLDTLASLIDMDVFSFSRAFKMKTGEAPHQFLIARRLMRAREMLRDTNYPLAEIAYATGFSSQSHMTATFSRHFGTPPGVWRKAVRT